jgi:hypothetical protein
MRNNGGFRFGNLLFLFTQSGFSGMEPVSKVSNTRNFSLSFFASFLAGCEFPLQFFGALLSNVQCPWVKGRIMLSEKQQRSFRQYI